MEASTATSKTLHQGASDDDQHVQSIPPPQPQLKPRMLVTFTISLATIQSEWPDWPEFIAEVEHMKFKRYHAYVYMSSIHDPFNLWKAQNRPPNPPPEKVRLALIGPAPPKPDYYLAKIGFQDPVVAGELYHPVGFKVKTRLPVREERKESREPLKVNGPEFRQCNVEPAYLYTGRRHEVIGISTSPSARGTENRWMIATNAEDDRLGQSFLEDEIKLRKLANDWDRDNPEDFDAKYTRDGETPLSDGINPNIELDSYRVPVEFSMDMDSQDQLEDPCDFVKEVTAVRSALYRNYKRLKEMEQAEEEVDSQEDEVDPQEAEVDTLEAEVDSLEAEVNPLEAEVNPLEAEVDPLMVKVDPLEVEVDPLEVKVDPLEAEGDTQEAEVDPLEAEVNPLEEEVDPLEVKVGPLEVEVDTLEMKVDTLEPKQDKELESSRISWPTMFLSGAVVATLSLMLWSRTVRRVI
ncbi:hypothetical protein FS837_011670 [Tulasnella sp. UAMH 9824]|nr:hypothetical protein FS837_011670 [Tulasnella sp. UAMH 9824]